MIPANGAPRVSGPRPARRGSGDHAVRAGSHGLVHRWSGGPWEGRRPRLAQPFEQIFELLQGRTEAGPVPFPQSSLGVPQEVERLGGPPLFRYRDRKHLRVPGTHPPAGESGQRLFQRGLPSRRLHRRSPRSGAAPGWRPTRRRGTTPPCRAGVRPPGRRGGARSIPDSPRYATGRAVARWPDPVPPGPPPGAGPGPGPPRPLGTETARGDRRRLRARPGWRSDSAGPRVRTRSRGRSSVRSRRGA